MAERQSMAIERARARRVVATEQRFLRVEWFISQLESGVRMAMSKRVRVATAYVKDRVVRNISTPVVKIVRRVVRNGRETSRVYVDPTSRSKPDEFPHADTTTLMKTIFDEVREIAPGMFEGYIGTPLEYGLRLETKMDRSFLVRTLYEESDTIARILGGPLEIETG